MNRIWPSKQLGDLIENGEVSYGVVQPGAHVDSGIPIVRVKDFRSGRLDVRDPLRVAPSISARHGRTVLRGGELLLSIVGTVGESAVVPVALSGWNVARAIAVIRPRDVSAQWIQLCLQTSSVRAAMTAMLNTTVQATLNLSDLKRISIPVPPQRERDAIAEVMGALDDKIAANDHLERTTDELVAALFARLCAGAQWGRLKDIARVNTTVTKPIPGGNLRYLDISSVSTGSFELPAISSWDDAPGRARRVLEFGDTVWSTVRPNRRSHALILDDDASLIGSTGLAVLSPKDNRIASVYESTRTNEFVRYLESVAEGSAYPAVRGDRFGDAPIPALSQEEWDHFESFALPMRKRAHAAAQENRSLVMTRDELLPLLMSGKLRVRDAEKVVEEVA